MTNPCDGRKPDRRSVLRRHDGIAFLAVLMAITALSFLAIVGALGTRTELQIADTHRSSKEALTVAEAGVSHVYSLVRANPGSFDVLLTGDGTGGALASVGQVVDVNGESYRFREFGARSGDGYYVRILDNHDETIGANDSADDRDRRVYIESRGHVGRAQRVVRALLSANKDDDDSDDDDDGSDDDSGSKGSGESSGKSSGAGSGKSSGSSSGSKSGSGGSGSGSSSS